MSILDSIGSFITGSGDVQPAKTYNPYNVNRGDYSNPQADAAAQGQTGTLLSKFSNLSAPQAAQVKIAPNTGAVNAGYQNDLIGQLRAQANGTGPSLASGMLKEGTDRTLAGQMAAASTLGASNPALAQRQLAGNAITANQQLAQASAQQRMQDQINAQNQLGALTTNARGQDIGLGEAQANLTQGTNLANLTAGITTNGQNIGAAENFNMQQNDYANNARQALENYNQLNSTNTNSTNQLNENALENYYARQQAKQQSEGSALAGLVGGVGSIMAPGLSTAFSTLLNGAGGDSTSNTGTNPFATEGTGLEDIGYNGEPMAPNNNPAYGTNAQENYFATLGQNNPYPQAPPINQPTSPPVYPTYANPYDENYGGWQQGYMNGGQ